MNAAGTAGTEVEPSAGTERLDVLDELQWPLMERLFEQVFGHAIDRRLTAWKYGPGRGLSIALVDHREAAAPRAVAHCGLVFRDLLIQGRPVRGAQIADSMVSREQRGRLRGGSPFERVGRFAQQQLGGPLNPGNPDRFVYGFPSDRAMRLGCHLGLYREIDRIHEVSWSACEGRLPERVEAAGDGERAQVDQLWRGMRHDLADALVGVRDGAWFLDRYLRHPTHRYQVHRVRSRWWRRPLGYFALREEGGRLELSDWVAPLAHTGELIDAARAVAWQQGGQPLFTWAARRAVPLLQPRAASVTETQFGILCRGDTPEADHQRWRDRWWLSPGDTDYR